jgi:hypothetical protein
LKEERPIASGHVFEGSRDVGRSGGTNEDDPEGSRFEVPLRDGAVAILRAVIENHRSGTPAMRMPL